MNALCPGELLATLIELDAMRADDVARDAERDRLTDKAIALMKRAGLQSVDITPDRSAVLDHPVSTSLEVEDFERYCRRQEIAPAKVAAAIKRSVSLVAARKLLGGDALDKLATTSRGAPRIRFLSAARKKEAV